jgi:hypothetical protein
MRQKFHVFAGQHVSAQYRNGPFPKNNNIKHLFSMFYGFTENKFRVSEQQQQ